MRKIAPMMHLAALEEIYLGFAEKYSMIINEYQ